MRRFLVPLLLVCLPAFAQSPAPDSPALRRAAAERYFAVNDLQKILLEMVTAMTRDLPPEKAASARDLVTRHVRIEVLKEAMLISMTRHFTAAELDALATFYGSPEGKSVVSKFGPYMTDIVPMIEAEVRHAAEAAKAEQDAGKPGT